MALIQTGWSANQYLYDSNRRSVAHGTHNQNKRTLTLEEHLQQILIPKDAKVELFLFRDPDDKFDRHEIEALKKFTANLKKRQQVIFIKNPENRAYEKAIQNLVQNTAQQQKSHIYVLNKEPNYAAIQQKLQSIYKNAPHKPQVHFVKYRTPADFHSVQQAIIEKYGATGNNKVQTTSTTPKYGKNEPVRKDYAKNFLPMDIDVVPGSSYIPLIFYY